MIAVSVASVAGPCVSVDLGVPSPFVCGDVVVSCKLSPIFIRRLAAAADEILAEMLWVISQRLIAKHGFIDSLFPPPLPLEDGTHQ
jgi:hypothetical protein